MHNQSFINSIIQSATGDVLRKDYITAWFLIDIFSHHDAMGVVLMGGEL